MVLFLLDGPADAFRRIHCVHPSAEGMDLDVRVNDITKSNEVETDEVVGEIWKPWCDSAQIACFHEQGLRVCRGVASQTMHR